MSKVEQILSHAERIGVIGSPSSTSELALDIMASAVNKKLVGELAIFPFMQDNFYHYSLGQITEVTLRNVWHEDPTMRSLIRQKGKVDAVSERQDTHQGKMTISAVFKENGERYVPSILGTVPSTGTQIKLVSDKLLDTLLEPYKEQIFYLGHVYGSTPRLPLWFKHFDSGVQGAGEAYHLGIFGKTGSGKSTLAKMVLIAYAKHKKMGMFIFDPQGEFSLGLRHQDEPQNMGHVFSKTVLDGLGRQFRVYNLNNIQLDRWEVLSELLLEFGFFQELGFKNQYQSGAAEYAENFLRDNSKLKMANLDEQALVELLRHILSIADRVYAQGAALDRVTERTTEVLDLLENDSNTDVGGVGLHDTNIKIAVEKWNTVIQFFRGGSGRSSASTIIKQALDAKNERPIIVVDLSQRPSDISQSIWDTKIKPLLIDRFLGEITRRAETAYQDDRSLNTLVVLDEAHRLAPQGRIEDERLAKIRERLVDAVRTTRKYGLGWMFLSQSLSSLHSEIIQQTRIFFIGFGLSMGSEYQRLREMVSGQKESLNLYQRFRDPQSAFDTDSREFSFMTIGPVSPLSFSGTPLFLNAFNKIEDFLSYNNLTFQKMLLSYDETRND